MKLIKICMKKSQDSFDSISFTYVILLACTYKIVHTQRFLFNFAKSKKRLQLHCIKQTLFLPLNNAILNFLKGLQKTYFTLLESIAKDLFYGIKFINQKKPSTI